MIGPVIESSRCLILGQVYMCESAYRRQHNWLSHVITIQTRAWILVQKTGHCIDLQVHTPCEAEPTSIEILGGGWTGRRPGSKQITWVPAAIERSPCSARLLRMLRLWLGAAWSPMATEGYLPQILRSKTDRLTMKFNYFILFNLSVLVLILFHDIWSIISYEWY